MKILSIIAVMFLTLVALPLGLSYTSWVTYNYFAPKYENTSRLVFEQSVAYNQGMLRDLENLQMEYSKASDTQKIMLKDVILHRFSVYDGNMLPNNLKTFYQQLKGN